MNWKTKIIQTTKCMFFRFFLYFLPQNSSPSLCLFFSFCYGKGIDMRSLWVGQKITFLTSIILQNYKSRISKYCYILFYCFSLSFPSLDFSWSFLFFPAISPLLWLGLYFLFWRSCHFTCSNHIQMFFSSCKNLQPAAYLCSV